MISVKQLLYKTDLRLNKVATNDHQNIPDEDKLFVINENQIKLIKKKISTNNIYQLGLDGFRKRYEDLQNLIIQSEKSSKLKKGKDRYNYFLFDTKDLKNKCFSPIGITAMCSKGECKDRAVAISKVVKHANLQTDMANSNYFPSFEYQETIALESEDKIYIYTDGTFDVDYVFISYLRYPKKVDLEGYVDLDGNDSVTQDCELQEFLEDELLDMVQMDLAISTENPSALVGSQIKEKNNE